MPIVLTALMLTSVLAGIDFADELKDTNEMETGGRVAKELKLHDVLQPRETFVDAAGNTRNGIDIGDIVYFRPIIINEGDDAHDEFNIRVTVTPAGDNQQAIIDNLDDAVCPGDVAVTGCSFNTLPSGDFLGGGNYRVQAASGGDLSWTPTIAGEYTVYIQIDVDSSMDSDLTNNDMTYTVVVQHYRDIVVDLCWTEGPTGDCKTEGATDNVNGAGPHDFMVTVTADGSEEWQPRNTAISVDFGGQYVDTQSGMWIDGNFNDVAAFGAAQTVAAGETAMVDVWHNVSDVETTSTDANDINENPCTNLDNPCAENREVLVFQVSYMFRGVIMGDAGAEGASSVNSFSVTTMLDGFDLYAPTEGAAGGLGPGGEEENAAIIMTEQATDYDDRTGNNDGTLSGFFSVFHDIGVTSLTGGPNAATEGTLNVGETRLTANVVYGGSDSETYYDWHVVFTVVDEDGIDVLAGMANIANECLTDDDSTTYTHTTLSQSNPGSTPEGWACIDVTLTPGRYTVTATSVMVNANDGGDSSPADATDMNSGNDMRGTFFEVINDNPTVYMTLDDITRDGQSVEAPIIAGDIITMRARGSDTETPEEELQYSWTRVTATGERMEMQECLESICTAETDASWIGQRMITATVTDGHAASTTDSMLVSVWNSYTHDMSITGATLSYSLVFSPMVAFNVTAVDGASYTQQQLGNNAGAFDSVVSFDMTSSNVFNPTDIGAESLTIDFEGDATSPWGLWYQRTADSQWTSVNHVTTSAGDNGGVTMTFNHDGGLEGNLNGGTYAIFDVATAGAEPPATGVTGLTATLQPGAQVVFEWGYDDDSLLGSADTVNLYHCSGEGCDPMGGTAMPAMNPTTTDWTLVGADAQSYTIHVQTENGNTDVVTGAALTGGGMAITVTADGSVSPAPSINADVPSAEGESLTFTWTATSADDVASWMVCWAASQSVVQDSFDSVVGDGACAETTDTTTSLTVTEQDMCGGSCSSNMFFAVGAKDTTGNVYSPEGDSHLMTADYSTGVVDPGVIEGDTDREGQDEGMPSTAIAAIIVLVVVAVIGGAFILTRGAEGDGEDKEWDY
ncbi:MAG: hypothetical protein VYA86_01180 [Candidatus Thermoplasmatota archaeon]|nr:hypothetical protein [Candidatus Thermoplasmatota archaeon]